MPGFFESARESEGRSGFKGILNDASSLPQSFSNVNSLDDVYRNYGVNKFDTDAYRQQVASTFNPARQKVNSQRARSLANAARFMGGRSATPGMTFSNIESAFNDNLSDIAGQEAGANLAGFDKKTKQDMDIANLFMGLNERKDSGAVNALNARSSAMNNYLQSLSPTSGFDDLMAGVDTVGKFGGIKLDDKSTIFSKLFGMK